MSDPKTAAEVCQYHLDNLGKYKKGGTFRRGLAGAVAAAVYDLLLLTRNTDAAGRAASEQFRRDMDARTHADKEQVVP